MSNFLTDPIEIKAWLDQMDIWNYIIHPGGVVDVDGRVDISKKSLTKIPIQFGTVAGTFKCAGNNLTSLSGSPRNVGDTFDCADNSSLTSLEGCPEKVGSDFDMSGCGVSSLDHLPAQVGYRIFFPEGTIKSNILKVMLVQDLVRIVFHEKDVKRIINKHLNDGKGGDIFACQQELIDAGFEEYAQL